MVSKRRELRQGDLKLKSKMSINLQQNEFLDKNEHKGNRCLRVKGSRRNDLSKTRNRHSNQAFKSPSI